MRYSETTAGLAFKKLDYESYRELFKRTASKVLVDGRVQTTNSREWTLCRVIIDVYLMSLSR
jgi:hypothetical protein